MWNDPFSGFMGMEFLFADAICLGMTVDRMVGIWFPLKFKSINNRRFLIFVVFLSFILSLGWVPRMYKYDIVSDKNGTDYKKVKTAFYRSNVSDTMAEIHDISKMTITVLCCIGSGVVIGGENYL